MGTYNKYPQEVHEFIKKWTFEMTDAELSRACNEKFGTNFSASSMKAFRANHKYYAGQKRWEGEEYWKHQTRYPEGMYEFIRDNSEGVTNKKMAEMVNERFGLNYSESMMKGFRRRFGIKSGCTGQFQKGCVSYNKGKKREEFMTPEGIEKAKKTEFKKGHTPVNTLPLGTIVTNKDGYYLIKVKMKGEIWERWNFLHRAIWEKQNGPIPEGMNIIFKDSDRTNCNIENLAIVSKKEAALMQKMNLRFEDPDLTETGVNIAKLQIAIKERMREKSDKQMK